MEPYPTSQLSPEEAHEIDFALAVMSLDLATGTLKPMGLDVPDEAAFRTLIRDELGHEPLGPAIGEAGAARVALLLHRLTTELGAPFVDHLVAWIRDVFLGSPDPQVFLWHRVIVAGGLHGGGDESPPPPLVVLVRTELSDLLCEAPPKVPQSRWDKGLLTAYGFPTSPTDGWMESSPLSIVENHMDDVAFVTAWSRALARSTSPDRDIDALWSWGKREGEAMGFRTLARPSSFRG